MRNKTNTLGGRQLGCILLSLLALFPFVITGCAEKPEDFRTRVQSATLQQLFSEMRDHSGWSGGVLLFRGSLAGQSVLSIEVTDDPQGAYSPEQVGTVTVDLRQISDDPRAVRKHGNWTVVIKPVSAPAKLTDRYPELVADGAITLPFNKWIDDWRNEFAAGEFVKRLQQARHTTAVKTERP